MNGLGNFRPPSINTSMGFINNPTTFSTSPQHINNRLLTGTRRSNRGKNISNNITVVEEAKEYKNNMEGGKCKNKKSRKRYSGGQTPTTTPTRQITIRNNILHAPGRTVNTVQQITSNSNNPPMNTNPTPLNFTPTIKRKRFIFNSDPEESNNEETPNVGRPTVLRKTISSDPNASDPTIGGRRKFYSGGDEPEPEPEPAPNASVPNAPINSNKNTIISNSYTISNNESKNESKNLEGGRRRKSRKSHKKSRKTHKKSKKSRKSMKRK